MPNYKALDGGWGWGIVLGCSSVFLVCAGPERAYGVLYIHLLEKYNESSIVTAWAGGLTMAVRLGLGEYLV